MIKIKSINNETTWIIDTKKELTEEEKNHISKLNPQIYHNDLTGRLWSFDTKILNDKWLENITYNNELTEAKAIII